MLIAFGMCAPASMFVARYCQVSRSYIIALLVCTGIQASGILCMSLAPNAAHLMHTAQLFNSIWLVL
jgi:hypothetical protein